jgi:hypothetical protein
MAVKRKDIEKLMFARLKKASPLKALRKSLNDNKRVVIALQQNQMQQGDDANGGKFPPYSKTSVEVFGKRPGPWTLRETGAFYSGMRVTVDNTQTSITSTDPKTQMLQDKVAFYRGGDVFGLNEPNTVELGDFLLNGIGGDGPFAEEYKRQVLG